jgi:hypothetical protein
MTSLLNIEDKITIVENNIQILEKKSDMNLYNDSINLIDQCEKYLSNITINNNDYSKYKNKDNDYLLNKLNKINESIKETDKLEILVDLYNKSNYIINILLNDLEKDKNIIEID